MEAMDTSGIGRGRRASSIARKQHLLYGLRGRRRVSVYKSVLESSWVVWYGVGLRSKLRRRYREEESCPDPSRQKHAA